ncbi:PAS domain S-box protein [Devosia sp. D6-9]|nr:PAS domain S-box protein [Devosia sp. D6-9]
MADRVAISSVSGEMAQLINRYDWQQTSLGPMSTWPLQLKHAVDLSLPSQAQIVLFCGPDMVAIYNDAYAPTIGTKHPGALGKPAREYWSELWDDLRPLLMRVMETGETVVAKDRQFYIERGDTPETVYFDISYSPVRNDAGQVIAVFCVVSETTSRMEYEGELRRLASIISSSQDAIMGINLDLIVTDWNAGAEKLYGFSRDEIVGQSVNVLIPADRLDEETRIIEHIKAGGRLDPHETVRRHKSGRLVDVSLSVSPIVDASGRVIGASKIARDITDRKEAERIQSVLAGELNHRVKNVLATVMAIARQTFSGNTDPKMAKASFEARIHNLARAHDLLTRGSWESASLSQVVAQALSPYPSKAFQVEGPELNIPPKAVLALALILHELATNAAKYGALAVSSGRVMVSWVAGDGTDTGFRFVWKEVGGPVVVPTSRKGFGSRLIQSLSAGQLQGTVEMTYDADGVRCEICAPLSSEWVEEDHELVTEQGGSAGGAV